MMTTHFADRLFEATREKKSHVVAGLDPRAELMPPELIRKALRRRGDSPEAMAEAIVEFNAAVIDAVADLVAAVKCQIAYYECYGVAGLSAYRRTIRLARDHGLIVIGDVKRNDIGSTAKAYAMAHLRDDAAHNDDRLASDFHVDAITVNPLFGADGVLPFVERAARSGSGVFVLVRTSNRTSGQLQDLQCNSRPFHRHVASLVQEWGEGFVGKQHYSLLGAVVGATFPAQLKELRAAMPGIPFLIPGFGAQGGGVADAIEGFDRHGGGALVSSSRALIYAFRNGRYASDRGGDAFKDAVRAATEDMRSALWEGVRRKR